MKDYKVDETGDLVINERGDIEVIDDAEEFEQRLSLYLQAYHHRVISQTASQENKIEMLKLQSKRVAQDFSIIDRMIRFEADFEDPATVDVNVDYRMDRGETRRANITLTEEPELRKITDDDN